MKTMKTMKTRTLLALTLAGVAIPAIAKADPPPYQGDPLGTPLAADLSYDDIDSDKLKLWTDRLGEINGVIDDFNRKTGLSIAHMSGRLQAHFGAGFAIAPPASPGSIKATLDTSMQATASWGSVLNKRLAPDAHGEASARRTLGGVVYGWNVMVHNPDGTVAQSWGTPETKVSTAVEQPVHFGFPEADLPGFSTSVVGVTLSLTPKLLIDTSGTINVRFDDGAGHLAAQARFDSKTNAYLELTAAAGTTVAGNFVGANVSGRVTLLKDTPKEGYNSNLIASAYVGPMWFERTREWAVCADLTLLGDVTQALTFGIGDAITTGPSVALPVTTGKCTNGKNIVIGTGGIKELIAPATGGGAGSSGGGDPGNTNGTGGGVHCGRQGEPSCIRVVRFT